MHRQRIVYGCIIVLGLCLLVGLYASYDPMRHTWFPKCPFKSLTGYDCPGCGSQRAIHHLLNGHLVDAFRSNALMVLAIPYVLLALVFEFIKKPSELLLVWRKRLYGQHAIAILLVVILMFWLLRNMG
ncbi:MAG: DUF2752 domain-containing protein [Prevotellaceae bacterium]|jgi:hypothetical protein|nr:DUF2752 domain-containing protein [Prevotellaceae bacterium]